MSAKKAKLNSENGALQFKLDALVAVEVDLKAKYEVELKAVAENLKKAQDQKSAVEVAQKFVEDRTFTTKTAISMANSNFEAMVVEKDKHLAEARKEAEWVEVETKVVMSFKKKFPNTH
ncbi:hypothetical protein Adt_21165 [Abeliophyllum distichum]|uniref:Uncharacterized protein n=1 Tax=Abeliophyllum distichum TaxID=126358 RepID=A0ABD1SYN2_9LAMI